ncbi:hypothetical protein KUV57_12320 [Epibacterium sp. DP7N7-1]|nr:hypothetical protein [Epibacterium sp. DP7N7-1]
MGGTVSVTIRRASGEVIPMTFYTDMVMPHILDPDVLMGDDAAVDAVVDAWKGAGKLYAENASPGMDPDWLSKRLYGHEPMVAPRDYGIVVLDLMSGKLFDMQDFSNLKSFLVPKLQFGPGFSGAGHRHQVAHDAHATKGWIENYELAVKEELNDALETAGFTSADREVYKVSPDRIDAFSEIVDAHRARTPREALDGLELSPDAPAGPVMAALQKLDVENEGKVQDPCHLATASTTLGGIVYHSFDQGADDAKELLDHLDDVGFDIDGSTRDVWGAWIDRKHREAADLDAWADDDALSCG